MKKILSFLFLTALTVGAVFLFRFTLQEALINADIEELARYNAPTKLADSTVDTTTDNAAPMPAITETKNTQASGEAEPMPTMDAREVNEAKTEVSAPGPLTRTSLSASGTLTVPGVVAVTNAQRTNEGLGSLTLNTKLTNAAAAKLADMFDKQYFAHVSPDGTAPSDWVDGAGYAYRLTGENLALGDFSGETDLVTAWMNSPGHRANILKPEYTEIGVAVGKGMYEGRETWLAVQVFGKPLPNCPLPNKETKATITANQEMIKADQDALTKQKEELDAYEDKSSDEYRAKVDAYNTLVADYNNLIGETESLVSEYNVEVSSYNACIEG